MCRADAFLHHNIALDLIAPRLHHAAADAEDDAPYLPALKSLRRLRDERPKLGQLLVPCAEGVFKISYYPIITYCLRLSSI